jgi:flavin-dependent dehydrogenase
VQAVDAIVVGGGPAGSTCAWKLREAGLDVLVLDRATFPRTKLCAGWVTPEALADLELDSQDYPLSFMTFDRLHLHWKAFTLKLKSRQHSIRRYEFDDYLLQRAGATVLQHKVRDIRREGIDYVVDEQFRCKYLVGAGGTACPVYRTLFHDLNPRSSALQIATYEQEFAYDWQILCLVRPKRERLYQHRPRWHGGSAQAPGWARQATLAHVRRETSDTWPGQSR